MTNRRETFRRYMSRLNAAAHPREAIEDNLYVARPGTSVADHLVRRLELEPASSHVLVGGVGSGKTTQLLMTQKQLDATSDVHTFFVDVSERHDLSRLRPSVLLVLAGLTLAGLAPQDASEAVKQARKKFTRWAHGYIDWVDERESEWGASPDPDDDDDDRYLRPVQVQGVIVPPQPALRGDIQERAQELKRLRDVFNEELPHIVFLFDSLDRLTDLKPFAEVVEQDIRAIKAAGIGVVVVGPLRTLFGTGRPIVDRFDYLYHQPSVDVQQDAAGRDFLATILRRRVAADVLPDLSLRSIVEFSGGVLRDLISLARSAGEEAYTDGADSISRRHVEAAADAFGRSLMLGLGPDEIEVLQRVRLRSTFVQTSDKDIALLVTRRVLEYGNGTRRYAVHPTISPLLEQLKSSA
jgi:hypothetical protein